MNAKQAHSSSAVITPREVYYILHRHKWLIIILTTLSIAAAVVVRQTCSVPYTSEAKLMIKYVHENKPIEHIGFDATPADRPGDGAVNSEIEVMTSGDIASSVVDVVGASRILAKIDGGTNKGEAAAVVKSGLMAYANRSDVVLLLYTHPDPDMVQPILGAIMDAYLKKHHEIHQGSGDVDFLQKLKEEAAHKIADKDNQMTELKHQLGASTGNIVTDLPESERMSSELANKILSQKLEAEDEYSAHVEVIKEIEDALPKLALAKAINGTGGTNNVIPLEIASEYRKACEQLAVLQSHEDDMTLTYAPDAAPVKRLEAQITRVDTHKKELETKYPGLLAVKYVETKGSVDPMMVLREEKLKAEALLARIKKLGSQLSEVQTNTATMNSYEGRITQLQRDKDLAEEEELFYSRKLDEAQVNQEVGAATNISPVEQPTSPSRDLKKFNKTIAAIFFGGLVLAFGLPFLIEFYLDRTLKRPLDVQARLGLPFFISIPLMNGKNGSRALKKPKKRPLLPGASPTANGANGANGNEPAGVPANGSLVIWEELNHLQPFYETLRDRLMTYFEMHNLTHKPKLVAVTSCGEGAGVTSTAAGLASSLSETGDGNVLLVNMNGVDGEAHHFYKGKVSPALDEVLEKETREHAFVSGNLYVAKEQSMDDRLPRVLPKRFTHLLPKLKASDFDYIIFDMPPISQISITPRLARFMDMVLLVVESGKTDRDVAARAAAVLTETKTHVGVVLNKNQDYGPRRLHHDI